MIIRIKRRNRLPEVDQETEEQESGRNAKPKTVGYISLRLTHALLPGNLLIRRFHGRPHWEVMYAVTEDGYCADGMQALLVCGLELDSHKSELPKLVSVLDTWIDYQ